MLGKNPRMNPLESRKQLLLVESELNRAQLARDMAELTAGVRTLTERAKSIASIFSSAAVLVSALRPSGAASPRTPARNLVAANHSKRRGPGFHALAGVPLPAQ